MTTISVVIATYGEGHWEDLAKSRAFPTAIPRPGNRYPPEWDNGGPDETMVLHLPDGTRASSLNLAAENALGDWLLFLDADDELAPGYVGAMKQAVEKYSPAAYSPVYLFTPATVWVRKGIRPAPGFQTEVPLERGNWLVIGTLISRRLFNEIGGFHEHPHGLEDWNLWARAVRAGARIVKVPDAVYIAHVNPQSKHRQLFRANRRGYWDAYEKARLDAWG